MGVYLPGNYNFLPPQRTPPAPDPASVVARKRTTQGAIARQAEESASTLMAESAGATRAKTLSVLEEERKKREVEARKKMGAM